MRSSKRLALAIELFDEVDHLLRKCNEVATSEPIVGNKEAVATSIDERIDSTLQFVTSLAATSAVLAVWQERK